MAEALRLKKEVNATIHRDDFGNRTADALQHVTRPGGLPFVLFMLLIAVLAVRALGQTDLNPVSAVGKLSQILFALLATVTSFFSFFLYKEGDIDPGKYIIKKRFFKAHRAQIALRRSISRGESLRGCIDEVCAAVDGDAGGGVDDVEDGDGESPSLFVSTGEPK